MDNTTSPQIFLSPEAAKVLRQLRAQSSHTFAISRSRTEYDLVLRILKEVVPSSTTSDRRRLSGVFSPLFRVKRYDFSVVYVIQPQGAIYIVSITCVKASGGSQRDLGALIANANPDFLRTLGVSTTLRSMVQQQQELTGGGIQ